MEKQVVKIVSVLVFPYMQQSYILRDERCIIRLIATCRGYVACFLYSQQASLL
jgi:hypothetical protein